MFIGTSKKDAQIWDKEGWQLVETLTHSALSSVYAIDNDDDYIYTGSSDNSVSIWDKDDLIRVALFKINGKVRSIYVDGAYIYAGTDGKVVNIWEPTSWSSQREKDRKAREAKEKKRIEEEKQREKEKNEQELEEQRQEEQEKIRKEEEKKRKEELAKKREKRMETFQKMFKKTSSIQSDALMEILEFESKGKLLKWLYDLPEEYNIKVEGSLIHFNWEEKEGKDLQGAIDSLLKQYEEWELNQEGKA